MTVAREQERTKIVATEIDSDRPVWTLRPWLLGVLGALTGLGIHLIVGDAGLYGHPYAALKTASASFLAALGALIGFTLERERWQWSLAFSLLAALAIGLILYWNGAPDQWSGGDGWRVVCIFLSVAIAAPLFQAARDQGALHFPYAEVHGHALTNVVMAAAAGVFVGVVLLLTALLAQLFALIKITLLKDLLQEQWFGCILVGAALGTAVGILRERDRIVRVIQRIVVVVLGVLAPILGAGLLLFLLSLPFTGLSALWDATKATTPILLACVIGALILANAVIGNGDEEEQRSPPLRYGAMALGLAMLPLAVIAAVSTGMRIGQYGFTPDRLWAVVFVVIACAYGAAYLFALVRGRFEWSAQVRPANLYLAFGLCALALFLALPILSFNAISTRDQVARLQRGKVSPEKFDWAALRFDFGEPGRAAVARLAHAVNPAIRKAAVAALAVENRWDIERQEGSEARADQIGKRVRIVPETVPLPEGLLESFNLYPSDEAHYALHYRPGDRSAVMVWQPCVHCAVSVSASHLGDDGKWTANAPLGPRTRTADEGQATAIETGRIEIRSIERRQLFLDGKPVGEPFE